MNDINGLREDVSVVETDLSKSSVEENEQAKRMTRNQSFLSSTGTSDPREDGLGICPLHCQKMLSFCLQDLVIVCHKCLLYGNHKFHESLDLESEENR